MRPQNSAAHAWLQLFRAPNLFTVPGDPLAGFLLVSGRQLDARLAGAMLASTCFYGCGLLLNDLVDLEEDRRERPQRPLPSGAVRPGVVRVVAGVLAAFGLALAGRNLAFFVGLALLAALAIYNYRGKKSTLFGPANMGLCRGLSLLLGAAAALPEGASLNAIPPLAWTAAAGLTLYIALVTQLARVETLPDPPHTPRALPLLGLVLAAVPVFLLGLNYADALSPFNIALYAVSAYTLYAGYKIDRKLTREPAPPISPMIGQLIRLLLPLQAIWCLASRSRAGAFAAVVLLVLWPVSRRVSRRFYAS